VESCGYDQAVADSSNLTAEQAQAAVNEAGARASQVRRTDRQLSWMLLLVSGLYLGAGAVISLAPTHNRSYGGPVVLLMFGAAIGAAVVIGLRIRAYTRAGIIWYFAAIIAFNLWNSAVAGVSIITRFWAAGQPSYHFGISVLIGVVPLVIGAIVLARRARA
jgi:hypothetical protein